MNKVRFDEEDCKKDDERMVSYSKLEGNFRSKADLYEWFSCHLQFVLPPFTECKGSKFYFNQRVSIINSLRGEERNKDRRG